MSLIARDHHDVAADDRFLVNVNVDSNSAVSPIALLVNGNP
jgi:hypothetical protein